MSFTEFLITWLAKSLNIPADVLTTMQGVNRLHGLSKLTFPKELIPLNTRQLARGIINFAMLQHSPGWILPFWAERQYDPTDGSFIPRSHLGLSINITHRNWTAVGNPDCPIEPIVDPRGMVTPFPGDWSVDVWMKVDEQIIYPSRTHEVTQNLVDNLPVIQTSLTAANINLLHTNFISGNTLIHCSEISNLSGHEMNILVGFAVRPFNPEGVSMIHDLEFREDSRSFVINKDKHWIFSSVPDTVYCSNYEEGDCSAAFSHAKGEINRKKIYCPKGLASGFAAYHLHLDAGKSLILECHCSLVGNNSISIPPDNLEKVKYNWHQLLSGGTTIHTPVSQINDTLIASLTSLLMLTDKNLITPGPAIYHQFWFRDTAYMLLALNRFGFSGFCRPIIQSMQKYQERSGYFRSQQGEWDSNGQVLWTVWYYTLLSGDTNLMSPVFESLVKAVRWIDKTRQTGVKDSKQPYFGLLPAGLSAEHLGLIDNYFWDNFWSIAGIEAFMGLCRLLNRQKELAYTTELLKHYRQDIERACDLSKNKSGLNVITAAPARGIDHGMIGSICAWYPLQFLPRDDPRLPATLKIIMEKFFHQGMFYQQFIHSGLNPYLTLQLAHTWLYAGERKIFWNLLNTVLEHASPTLNFPEAIHPQTKGGSIGDGHHGWAAAEILLALRDAFVYEYWNMKKESYDLALLCGIPLNWFDKGQKFYINDVPIPGGKINLTVTGQSTIVTVEIFYEQLSLFQTDRWKIRLPFPISRIKINETDINHSFPGETDIAIPSAPGSKHLEIILFRSIINE